jgi:hypothetical protein
VKSELSQKLKINAMYSLKLKFYADLKLFSAYKEAKMLKMRSGYFHAVCALRFSFFSSAIC